MSEKYWKRRKRMMYYRYLNFILRGVAADCRSMIDVGSNKTSLIEDCGWIEKRVTIDLKSPYQSENVTGVQGDFLTYRPSERFDIAMCSQVLEHIPDATSFAQHLFEIADRVLISVPYLWPEGFTISHVQDPVDAEKLKRWTKRDPDYQVIVEEPLSRSANNKRLIAFYAKPGDEKWLRKAQATLSKSSGGKKKPKKSAG